MAATKGFSLVQNAQTGSGIQLGYQHFFSGVKGQERKVDHSNQVLRLRMSGGIPPLFLRAFTAWTGTSLAVPMNTMIAYERAEISFYVFLISAPAGADWSVASCDR